MAENLISKKYDISPKTVYKKGPYMHSVVENFIGNDYSIPQLEAEKYIEKLKNHLSTALTKEREFYDLIGVKDADDFSNTYLYALDKSAIDQETINRDIKIVQKILISIGSTLALIQNKSVKSVLPDLERAARQLIDNNKIPWIKEGAEQTALHSLRLFLEDEAKKNKGGKISLKNNQGKAIKIDLPSASLRSDVSGRVRSVLFKINPELKQLLASSPSEKIANFKQYFIKEAENYGLDSEMIPLYWNRIYALLEPLQNKTDNDMGNLSAFSNFLGAEGALGEIAMALTLEDAFLNKAKIAILANDAVTSTQIEYNAKEGQTAIKYTKSGARAKFTYKSPTDLTVTVGSEVYSIQVKTSYTELTATKALKLQGNIELQTLLGNMVSQGYMSNDTAQLLIYTMVNLSTPEMQAADGASSKTDLALRILQMCAEYFAESYYAREVVNPLIEKGAENNKGNMFFIYSGRLVPMSAFIKAAIFALEGENLTLAKNYYDTVGYGKQYSIEEIKKHNYIGRFDLGQEVYQETKIREIAFIIAQMDRKMNAYLN